MEKAQNENQKDNVVDGRARFYRYVGYQHLLYIVPQGRVAYWADWKLWGLTKTDWGNIHINVGLLFLIALFLHIYYNWKPLINYLKDKTKAIKVFTPEFNAALIITVAFFIGTYLMLPPFSWVMALNDHFKDSGASKYGEPPYGHAELSSLKTFAKKMNLDLNKSMDFVERGWIPGCGWLGTLQAIGKRYRILHSRFMKRYRPLKSFQVKHQRKIRCYLSLRRRVLET
jgi:hypothetical protein